jgi:hypothetical protein
MDIDRLIAALRDVKQREFNGMVLGDGKQPHEVIDTVVFTLRELVDSEQSKRLFNEVIMFNPDYTGG